MKASCANSENSCSCSRRKKSGTHFSFLFRTGRHAGCNRAWKPLIRLTLAGLATLVFRIEPSLSEDITVAADHKTVIEQVLGCLEKGQEAVLFQSQPLQCAPFAKGADVLKDKSKDAPFDVDVVAACADPGDLRKLPGDVIKQIARSANVNPTGIRIIGAVYCDALDLVGLELPYSLVMDRSVFRRGILGRSFHTRGDLSFDGSLIFGELFLARTHVDGTIFASGSAIEKMRLLDAKVHGSALFRNSLFVDLAAFDTVELSGELSVRNSYFPYLLIQFSKINGVLDLSYSQARCAYKVRKSDIGDVVAVSSGFGNVGAPPQAGQQTKQSYDWAIEGTNTNALQLLKAAERSPFGQQSSESGAGRICDRTTISFSPGSFLISDTRVRSSLCLRSFHWLEGGQSANSYVTLNDVKVDTAASIDLAQSSSTSRAHKLEIMGLETRSFFLKFSDLNKDPPYHLSLSGLKFEHVYASEVSCDYDPNFSDTDATKEESARKAGRPTGRTGMRSLANDADPAATSRLPRVEEVMGWLGGNSLATTQPFVAFVDVFQKHGEDNDAKALRIAKADTELCLRARRVIGQWICGKRKDERSGSVAAAVPPSTVGLSAAPAVQADGSSSGHDLLSLFRSFVEWGNEFVSLVLGSVLRVIADNGYHPEKVGWFVAFSIVAFGVYFWLVLGIVGLQPKDKEIILPIGLVFLFDRLLPAYQIREDHYKIENFFKLAPRRARTHVAPPRRVLRYFGLRLAVVPASPNERLGVERTLDVLKVAGLILAVFLVAAINAIVSH